MRALLSVALAAIAGLIAIPLPAFAGPTTCPPGAACIDESVEGATPIITAPSGFSGSAVAITGVLGEEWTITFSTTNANSAGVTGAPIGLLEPNSQSLSDALFFESTNFSNGVLSFQFTLFSDNDLGEIATTCLGCVFLTEDGTFQQTPDRFSVNGGPFIDVYLKSDVEVPEPASLVLLGTALIGFGVMRRRRRSS